MLFNPGEFLESIRRSWMAGLNLRLPESLHKKLGEVAEREGISINQLVS
jgi:predicted HicB family RNase H-like nuclease